MTGTMTRRSWLGALAGAAVAAAEPKPNFVFILADDLGGHDIGPYGAKYFKTPNLDKLAAQGAKFTNAYAACPVCSPSRAAILTGKYPVRTGVTDWIPGRPSHAQGPITTPRTATELKLEEQTIPERLKAAGYRSAAVGKWHLGGKGFSPTDQGFDVNVGGNESGSPPRSKQPYFGPFELPGISAKPGEFLTELLTQAACKFIEENRDQPYFLYLAHYTVHIPLGAREAAVKKHACAPDCPYNPVYAAMVESLDDSVGAVMEAIERSGAASRTVLVFFSDNGGLRYEGASQKAVTDNAPLRAGKGHLYEGGIREPMLVRWPGKVKAGAVIDTPVCGIDWAPTMCDLAGVPAGAVDGVSLRPLLTGGKLRARPLFWHYPHYSNQGGEPGSVIREGEWKLIEFHRDGRRELFNVVKDEGEKVNLVRKEPKVAARLAAKLEAWRKASGAVMPVKNPQADPNWPGWKLTGEEKPTAAAE